MSEDVKDKTCGCGCGHEDCACENHEEQHECKCDESKKDKKKKDKKEIEALTEQLNAINDKYLRLQAEYMNFRTRTAGEIEKMFKYSNETLALELLPTLDNFERAIKMDDNDLSDEVSKFLSGFKLIYGNTVNILNKFDVKEIASDGVEFDPNYHHAVLTDHNENKPEGVVLEVLQKGYTYKDRVIRPAMVKVNE